MHDTPPLEPLESYVPLAYWVAHRFLNRLPHRLQPADQDDALSEAQLGLVVAFRDYNPSFRVPFPLFASTVIRRRLRDFLRKQFRLSLRQMLVEPRELTVVKPSHEQTVAELDWQMRLKQFLTAEEYTLLEQHFLYRMKLREIAECQGTSVNQIAAHIQRTLRWLRHCLDCSA